jgi:hypothetical protein
MNHEDIKALYDLADKVDAFSGSDEWDLNAAWRDGFHMALDIILGRVDPATLSTSTDEE